MQTEIEEYVYISGFGGATDVSLTSAEKAEWARLFKLMNALAPILAKTDAARQRDADVPNPWYNQSITAEFKSTSIMWSGYDGMRKEYQAAVDQLYAIYEQKTAGDVAVGWIIPAVGALVMIVLAVAAVIITVAIKEPAILYKIAGITPAEIEAVNKAAPPVAHDLGVVIENTVKAVAKGIGGLAIIAGIGLLWTITRQK